MLNKKGDVEWMNRWMDMPQKLASLLPDVDVPINLMDESRVIMPWKDINRYVQEEYKNRTLSLVDNTINIFSLLDVDVDPRQPLEFDFIGLGDYWDTAQVGCPPDSPSRLPLPTHPSV